MKSESEPGTPLTIKWTAESPNYDEIGTEGSLSGLQVVALVSAFVVGFFGVGLVTWLLGQHFIDQDNLLGAVWVYFRMQRWGEKH